MDKIDIKTTKIGSDFSIQELIENDILGDVRDKLAKEISESYDNLAFFALAPYGITGENWMENVDRVCIVSQTFSKHFFVDDMYAFSIVTFVDYPEFNENYITGTGTTSLVVAIPSLGLRRNLGPFSFR